VKCGNQEAEVSVTCDATVKADPTASCTFGKSSYETGEQLKPTISCLGTFTGSPVISAATFHNTGTTSIASEAQWKLGQNSSYAAVGNSQYTISNITCDGVTINNVVCPHLTITNDGIEWGEKYTKPADNTCACYFLENNSNLGSSPYNGAKGEYNRGDGGVYIYACGAAGGDPNFSNMTNTAKAKPACTVPEYVPTLSCTDQSIGIGGTPNNNKLLCSDGTIPSTADWSGLNINSSTPNDYTGTVTATCGGKSTTSNSCTVTVSSGPVTVTKEVCGSTFVEFTAGTYDVRTPTSCGGGQFLCYGDDNITKTVTYGTKEWYSETEQVGGDAPAALKVGHKDWRISFGNAIKHATNTTPLEVSAGTIYCNTDW